MRRPGWAHASLVSGGGSGLVPGLETAYILPFRLTEFLAGLSASALVRGGAGAFLCLVQQAGALEGSSAGGCGTGIITANAQTASTEGLVVIGVERRVELEGRLRAGSVGTGPVNDY